MKKLYEISKKYPILAGIVGFLVIYLSFMYTPSTPDPNSYELAVLKIILNEAVKDEINSRNPANGIKNIKAEKKA